MFKFLHWIKLKTYFWLGLFISFFLDGSLSAIFGGSFFSDRIIMVSHLAFLWLLLALFFDRVKPLPVILAAFLVGIGIDFYYSGIIGMEMFIYPLLIWANQFVIRFYRPNIINYAMLVIVDLTLLEFYNYAMHSLLGLTHAGLPMFLAGVLGPTLLLNLVYFFVGYLPIQLGYYRILHLYRHPRKMRKA